MMQQQHLGNYAAKLSKFLLECWCPYPFPFNIQKYEFQAKIINWSGRLKSEFSN